MPWQESLGWRASGVWSQAPTGTPISAHLASRSSGAYSERSFQRHSLSQNREELGLQQSNGQTPCHWREDLGPQAQGSSPATSIPTLFRCLSVAAQDTWHYGKHWCSWHSPTSKTKLQPSLWGPRLHSVTQAASLGGLRPRCQAVSALHVTCVLLMTSGRKDYIWGHHCLSDSGLCHTTRGMANVHLWLHY